MATNKAKSDTLRLEQVEFIPERLEQGVIYYSEKYRTATHLCACGCGHKVVTPIKTGQWSLTILHDTATLSPSIGNFQIPCKSHYYIYEGKVIWV